MQVSLSSARGPISYRRAALAVHLGGGRVGELEVLPCEGPDGHRLRECLLEGGGGRLAGGLSGAASLWDGKAQQLA